jgi:(R,R)-butanediol dehydrogenase/meso-butanediol dehydrogenase/diacetyl reductase
VVNPMSVHNVIGNGAPEGALTTTLLLRNAVLDHGVVEVDDSVALDVAALTEPLSVALRGVKRSQAAPGAKVCVLGLGPIGLAAVTWLRYFGVTDIVAIDLSPARVQLAAALGASVAVQGGVLAQHLSSAHGDADDDRGHAVGTDIYLDCSGAASLVDEAIVTAKDSARIVIVALHHRPVPVRLDRVVLRELTIVGSRGYASEFNEVVAALAQLQEQLTQLVTHRYPLTEFASAIDAARSTDSGKVLLEINPRHR